MSIYSLASGMRLAFMQYGTSLSGAGQAGKDHGRDSEANWNSGGGGAGVNADLVEAFG